MKKNSFIILSALWLTYSCAGQVDKNVDWPEWPSRPIVSEASLLGSDGSSDVVAGDPVVFTANVRDDYNDLSSCTITIKYAGATAMEKTLELNGNTATIREEFDMPFSANLSSELVPDVSFEVVNAANGRVTRRLGAEQSVTVSRPVISDELFIVDNLGHTFKLEKTDSDYGYAPSASTDFTTLSGKFVIAEKLSGTAPDYSSFVWGFSDGKIGVIDSDGEWIETPDSGGYGFKRLGFDTYTFELDKLVNYSLTVRKDDMDSQEQSGVKYLVAANKKLVRYCEVSFEGFGDLSSMLQPDRFEIMSATSAKFTGHSRNWSFFYDTDDNWMILNYVNFNEAKQVWVTGEKACFPLGDASSKNKFKYLASDGKDRYATLAAVSDESGVYHCLVFLDDAFTIQLYSFVKWSTVISMVSKTPALCEVTEDGIYLRPGNEFKPGVYMLSVNLTKAPDNGGDGAVADVSLEPYAL